MSLEIAGFVAALRGKKLTRQQMLELVPPPEYLDGRTKQSFKDETDIQKIMARFDKVGTISHLAKFEGVYADFSDFDFHEQTTRLAKGQEIFDALPAELRQEFGQSAASFFKYVNDPKNVDDLRKKLPALAKPGQQLPRTASPDANLEKADKAASELASAKLIVAAAEKPKATPEAPPGDSKAD